MTYTGSLLDQCAYAIGTGVLGALMILVPLAIGYAILGHAMRGFDYLVGRPSRAEIREAKQAAEKAAQAPRQSVEEILAEHDDAMALVRAIQGPSNR